MKLINNKTLLIQHYNYFRTFVSMQTAFANKNFIVCKASAGSGKTYTLVKEFLKIVLPHPEKFRNVLAITFTNKATNEMKSRILKNLKELAYQDEYADSSTVRFLLPKLSETLGLSPLEISKNAENVLSRILHNYADFSISTIDSFVHRILRSFAQDLHLPMNFAIELSVEDVIQRAVDLLIEQLGKNPLLTEILIDFLNQKTENDQSWNIEKDIFETAKILKDEDAILAVDNLKTFGLEDFQSIEKNVSGYLTKEKKFLQSTAQKALKLISENHIPHDAFYQGKRGLPGYFEKLSKGNFDAIAPSGYVQKFYIEHKYTGAKVDTVTKNAIEQIAPDLIECCKNIEKWVDSSYKKFVLLNELQKRFATISVLNEVEKLVHEIKSKENILLISDFNRIISNVVMNESTPFVFERVGIRYQHFLLDEFQDTSIMQWQNLLPLVDNSLSEGHFNLIVGDGKQAIYRFRNGEVSQFIELPNIYKKQDDDVSNEREITLKTHFKPEVLKNNFRSKSEIINFNNKLYEHLKGLLHADFQKVYNDQQQQYHDDQTGGLVQIDFLDCEKENYEAESFSKITNTIKSLFDEGYAYKDIAILCIKNKTASTIASHLISQDIPVVSQESLLLSSSPKLHLLMAFIRWVHESEEPAARYALLNALYETGKITFDETQILFTDLEIRKSNAVFEEHLQKLNIVVVNRTLLSTFSLYDLCEEAVRLLELNQTADAYIQYFLDFAYSFIQKKNTGIRDFIAEWEEQKDKLSIVIPEGTDAVQIMTIHKSKGLEFPVVIFPFADEKIKSSKKHFWAQAGYDELQGLPNILVNNAKYLENTDFIHQYEEENEKSKLDLLNVLYVATTRPEERLYIMSKNVEKMPDEAQSISQFLVSFLQSENVFSKERYTYSFGEIRNPKSEMGKQTTGKHMGLPLQSPTLTKFISTSWNNKTTLGRQALFFQNYEQVLSHVEWGNIVHAALSMLESKDDISNICTQMFADGTIDESQQTRLIEDLTKVVSHPTIASYFTKEVLHFTERELLLKNGQILRPDRVIFGKDQTILMDYKTGKPKESDQKQIAEYAEILREMGYLNVESYLIYIHEEIEILKV